MNNEHNSHNNHNNHNSRNNRPLAFFETLDGYVAVRYAATHITVEVGNLTHTFCHDTTLRKTLTEALNLTGTPKLLAIDQVVFHEAPLSSHEPDSTTVLNLLECTWTDFSRDNITVTANIAYDNSESDRERTFETIRYRQHLYKTQGVVEQKRAPYTYTV